MKAIRAKFKQLQKDIPEGKSFKDVFEAEIMNDFFPKSPTPNVKTKEVVHAIVDLNDLVAYGDLTGKFPYRSSRGNQYLLIAYHYDGNNIQGVPLQNREAATINKAYKELNEYFDQSGIKPTTWVMDNEFSNES